MDIQPIVMDKKIARQHFERYRTLVRMRASKEDVALMRGFKALAQGKQILDLIVCLKKAGLDERFRPKLAIARADTEKTWYRHNDGGAGEFKTQQSARGSRQIIAIPRGTFSTVSDNETRWTHLTALVPSVPAQFRPAAALSNYHILWEPEWSEEPPHDPILLKRIAKYTFVVLAQWDLTLRERSVMRGV